MMMTFAIEKLGINIFRVKIGESNGASLDLFQKLVCCCSFFFYLFFCIKGMMFPTTVHLTY